MTITVTITDGRVDGYLTVREYCSKYGYTINAIQQRLYRKGIEGSLIIGGIYYLKDIDIGTLNTTIPDGYISVREWAEKNGIDVFLARAWVIRNKIDHVKIGRRNYVKANESVPKRKHDYWRKIDGYLSAKEYAEKHGVSKNLVIYWIQTGKIDYVRLNNKFYIIKEDEPIPEKLTRKGRPRKSEIMNRYFGT